MTEIKLGPIVEPFEAYLTRHEFICSSEVAALLDSPLEYSLMREENQDDKEPEHYVLGRAVHCVIIEPEQFENRYATFNEEMRPEQDKTMASKKNKEWKASLISQAKDAGVEYLTPAVSGKVDKYAKSIQRNPEALRLIKECTMFETSYYAEIAIGERKYLLRCRPDMMGEKHFVSIKTTKDPRPEKFWRDSAEYDYQAKEAFYWMVLNAVRRAIGMKELENGYIVAVGEKETFVYEMNTEAMRGPGKITPWLNDGLHLVDVALSRYDEMIRTGIVQGSEINFGGRLIMPMQTPIYKQHRIESLITEHHERTAKPGTAE
jgi:hypothetical protein